MQEGNDAEHENVHMNVATQAEKLGASAGR
jgi:hypothetical protein